MLHSIREEISFSLRMKKHLRTFRKFKDYTMVGQYKYCLNLALAERFKDVKGAIVECGVWRGGMSAGIATTLGKEREYHLFDSFEGLPDAKDIDGESAVKWQADTDAPNYYDNCKAEIEFAQKAMGLSGAKNTHFHQGWFKDTVGKYEGNDIAILRLDGDWYDSTMQCMDALFPKVVEGGLILIDDYYQWTGCSRAIHDYLSKEKSASRMYQFKNYQASYIIKTEENT